MKNKKIAFFSAPCKYIDDVLAKVKENHYVEWDLNTLPFSLSTKRMEYVRSFIADNGEVRFHLPYSFWDVGVRDETVAKNSFDYYNRLFDTIALLNAHYAVLHIGAATGSEIEVSLENLTKLAKHANDCGVKLCVENLVHGLPADPRFIKECLSIPFVNMCLDTGHAEGVMREKGMEIFNMISSFRDKILHAHVYHYEDENMNHVPFTDKTIVGYKWLDLLQDSPCEWYTMELDFQADQDNQVNIIKSYLKHL